PVTTTLPLPMEDSAFMTHNVPGPTTTGRHGWRHEVTFAGGGHRHDEDQATPSASAARATAAATSGATRGSSGLGTMASAASSSVAVWKIASAAASFMLSV